ncbi:MAG TPA: 3-oxoacyl-ACP reductase FabG [Pseudonocardia sp.]|nr:3-oxoacyl-ACP reductase FabG [Pseudonocardia sp.]
MSRVALVTGGNRGIGEAVASRLAAAGHRVAATYRGTPPRDGVLGVKCDVRSAAEVDEAFRAVENALGPVEILVANAGITRDTLLATMSENDFTEVVDTNLAGVYRVSKRAVRGMVRARWGRIVVISSVSGLVGSAGQANYAAAKAGLIGFARSTALELASRSITVNVVAPGWIDTDMTRALPGRVRDSVPEQVPLGRFGSPHEIANAVAFFAGEDAGYQTGTVLPVDGGLSLGR